MSAWAIPSFVAVVVLIFLNSYVIARRPLDPLWPSLPMALLPPLLFATGDLLTFMVTDPDAAWASVALLYTGILFVPSTWWLLAHRFAEASGHAFPWGRRRWVYAPFVLAILLWFGMITNPWHGQFLTQVLGTRNMHHWMWWIHATTGYTLVFGTVFLYSILAISVNVRPQQVRIYMMLSAAIVNIACGLLYIVPADPIPFDPTAAGFSVSGILFLFGIYRTGLFSLSPVAMTTILRHQPNGILVADVDGGLLYWNPAAEKVLRTSLGAVTDIYAWLGERLSILEEPDDRLGTPHVRRLLKNLESAPTDRVFRFQTDGEYCLRIGAAAIRTSRGRTIARCIQVEDYTLRQREEVERMRLQKQMAEAQKLESLGVLAGGIAHDFNNLLMTIRGNAEIALSDKFTDRGLRQNLEAIEEASVRGARLTQQLLAYAGNSPTETHLLNLSELVHETSEFLGTGDLLRGLDLELDLEDEIWVDGDQTQIEQVLMNLAINAAEASYSRSGRVFIATGVTQMNKADLAQCLHDGDLPEGSYAYVEVQDFGSGMSAKTLNNIFDPLFTTKDSGHGLGLAAVLGIVRTHYGAVWVRTVLGSGTTIRVLFPQAPQVNRPGQPVSDSGKLRAETVLVIDDQDQVRDVTCGLIESAGLSTLSANSGETAIEIARQQVNQIGVVILDMAMPGMDGVATFRALRQIRPDLPVVFISGHPQEDIEVNLNTEPHVRFLVKPFTKAQLTRKIREVESDK